MTLVRRRHIAPAFQPDRTVEEEFRHKGNVLHPGVEFSYRHPTTHQIIRVKFRSVVTYAGKRPWIDAWDGKQFRAVNPNCIIRIHRKRKYAGRAS